MNTPKRRLRACVETWPEASRSPSSPLPREVASEVGRRTCCRTVFPGPHAEATCRRWQPASEQLGEPS